MWMVQQQIAAVLGKEFKGCTLHHRPFALPCAIHFNSSCSQGATIDPTNVASKPPLRHSSKNCQSRSFFETGPTTCLAQARACKCQSCHKHLSDHAKVGQKFQTSWSQWSVCSAFASFSGNIWSTSYPVHFRFMFWLARIWMSCVNISKEVVAVETGEPPAPQPALSIFVSTVPGSMVWKHSLQRSTKY